MDQMCVYQISVRGQVDGQEVNTTSPVQMSVISMDREGTLLSAYTDQSGLIGVLRHLHARGVVLLSVEIHREQ